MSFHESLDPTELPPQDDTDNSSTVPPELLQSRSLSELDPDLFASASHEMIETFRDLVVAVMNVRDEKVEETPKGMIFQFQGNLLRPADQIFPELSEAIEAHGYTLYMEREGKFEQILIAEGVLVAPNIHAPWWFHLGLLIATLATTLFAGALLHGYTPASIQTAVSNGDRLVLLQMYRQAREFALPLLLILGIHEMGHYVAARLHGAKVTLPFFIPLPITGSLGTLGAVIFIKSPFRNRKQLFDVGIAGPLAGLVVAIIIFITAIEPPLIQTIRPYWLQMFNRVSVPPLLNFIADLLGKHENLDKTLFYNRPRALAAWFGILLTSLNLLPMGQFDGGHVAFALFGRSIAWSLSRIAAICALMIGILGTIGVFENGALINVYTFWFIFPLLAYFTGLRHPPPHNDITPLGWPRMILGYTTVVLFFAMIIITPFYLVTR